MLDIDKLQRTIKVCTKFPRRDCEGCEYTHDDWICLHDELMQDFDKAVEMLKEKRLTGQWDYGTQCSVCKGTIIPPKDRKVRVNFCPWCGADMRGGYDG